MREMNWFIDRHVELIGGEIIEEGRMTPQHWIGVNLAGNLLPRFFRETHTVCVRGEINMGVDSEPRPDIAVCAGNIRDYRDTLPTTADLIVEVADFTITEDRYRKSSLYARAVVTDYWIVNLRKCSVEVYRRPAPVAHKPSGYGYEECTAFLWDETVSPLVLPEVQIPVAGLLPQPGIVQE